MKMPMFELDESLQLEVFVPNIMVGAMQVELGKENIQQDIVPFAGYA